MATNLAPTLQLNFAKTKRLDPRITFSRASSGGYHGADGLYRLSAINEPRFDHDPSTGVSKGLLIEEARTNLLTYSEQFDNAAWTKTRSSITANAVTAPDGTTTADKLVESSAVDGVSTHLTQQAFAGLTAGQHTYGVYVKSAGRTRVVLGSWDGSQGIDCVFNLTTGVVDTTGVGGTARIDSVGNGWYRCSVTRSVAATTLSIYIYADNGSSGGATNSYTGDGTSGIYIWGAQLEAGAFATSYIPSTETFTSRASAGSFFGSNGLIQSASTNVARYNYNPLNLTLAPKLLIEEARTNLLIYSEQFDNAIWTQTVNVDTTVTPNAITAPDGTVTADKLFCATTASSVKSVLQTSGAITAGATITCSVYAKVGEYSGLNISAYDGGDTITGAFDLTGAASPQTSFAGTGAISSVSMTDVGNGWYRCSLTGIVNASATTPIFRLYLKTTQNASSTFAGAVNSGIYIWGAQLEAGSYPTSYIQTVASQVTRSADISSSAAATRSADVASMAGANFASWYNQTEGSFVVEASSLGCTGYTSSRYLTVRNAASTDAVELYYVPSTLKATLQVAITAVGTTGLATNNTTIPLGTLGKVAGAYKLDDFAISTSGSTTATDAAGAVPTTCDQMFIGYTGSTRSLNGHISSLAYFNTRVDNTTLKQLSASASNDVAPSLQLNFAKTKRLDPRVTFSRASTATYFDQAGVLRTCAINEPRFDHDPTTGASLGLLVEEARTNLVYKSQFDSFSGSQVNNVWIEVLAELDTTVNATTAPDGTTTAALLAVNTNTSLRGISQRSAVATGTTYTFSVFAKPASTDSGISLLLSGESSVTNYGRVNFTLTGGGTVGTTTNAGTATATFGKITALSDGWYRVTITVTLASPTNITCFIYPGDRSAQTTNSQTYIWGAQLEAGAFPTSYIPTTTAAATRSADVISMTGVNFSSWWNAVEGTIVAAYSKLAMPASGSQRLVTVSDGVGNESIRINSSASGAGYQPLWQVVDGGVTQVNLSTAAAVALAARHVTAAAYKVDDFAYTTDGVPVATDTAGTLPTVTQMAIGGPETTVATWNGCIERLTYFPRRLDNTTLQGLSL